MWAGLFAFPAVPEQVLREPPLSPGVDKRTIFKEREGENESGLSKPDKFPPNTPSLAAPTVQRAAGRSEIEGKRAEVASEKHVFHIAYIRRSMCFHGGIRVQVLEGFNMRYESPPVVIIKSLLVDLLLHFRRKHPSAHLWIY